MKSARTSFFTLTALCAVMAASSDADAQTARIAGARANPAVTGTASMGGARSTVGNASMSGLSKGMASFAADMGRMPTTSEGLMALIVRPPGAKNWRGPYISTNNYKAPFADPWGTQYRYTQQVNG